MGMFPSQGQVATSGLHAPRGMSPSRLGTYVLISVLVLLDLLAGTEAQAEPPTRSGNCTQEAEPCKRGLVVPMWQPQGNLSLGDKVARAIVYALSLVYMFLGVSIVADRFMAAIEVITSKEKDVLVKKPDGETAVVSVRIWNETVSNLTLMALGSSAPEILLAVIEIGHNNFKAGDLGPSTIVGSAAFNLFIIIAICVSTIPNGEIRRIKHLRVFVITASWSIFAYIWLYFIISVSSRGIIQVWEALLTFAFFPGTVLTAYIADRKFLIHHLLDKRYRAKRKGTMAEINDTELVDGKVSRDNEHVGKSLSTRNPSLHQFEQHRKDFIEILRDLRHRYPNANMRTLEEMAELEAVNRWPKSRAYYRIQATRKLIGAGKVIRKDKIGRRGSLQDVVLAEEKDEFVTKVYFDPGHYTVMENVGVFPITVTREGGDPNTTLHVDYHTMDGTANATTDYEAVEGTLIFQPGEDHKQFNITIIDDDVFEEDEHFYAHIKNPRLFNLDGTEIESPDRRKVELAEPYLATVMILDDDHPGIFHFESSEISVTENIGEMLIKVARSSGARGCVAVPFHAVDGTAKAGVDFEIISGELYFENDEAEQFIKINIVDDEEYEKTESFFLELEEPYIIKKSDTESSPSESSVKEEDQPDKYPFLSPG